ncbi:MAG: hypothetical protein QM820_12285 [Minicystis sp.]
MLADQRSEHAAHLGHGSVDVHLAHLEDLAPAEGQELTGQAAGALAGVEDDLGVAAHRTLLLHRAEDALAAAVDDGEQVVEVVGDAAGELADDLHLLGLVQVFLEPLALGHVGGHDDDAIDVFWSLLRSGAIDTAMSTAEPSWRSHCIWTEENEAPAMTLEVMAVNSASQARGMASGLPVTSSGSSRARPGPRGSSGARCAAGRG